MNEIRIINKLHQNGTEQIGEEIIKGLISDPKYISPKYFYDSRGSELFETITQLEEYYPTNTEKSILKNIGKSLMIDYNCLNVIEFGSGDHSKIQLLFDQIPNETLSSISYFPVDISESAIKKSATKLNYLYPMISITGIVADFMHQLITIPKEGRRLFCFLGSTIGNLSPEEVKDFMSLVGSEMSKGDYFLLGLDMVKDIEVLEKAYNDRKSITAEFNKNVLNVINSIINVDFNPDDFEHVAFFNSEKQRIEMHLKALENVSVKINDGSSEIFVKKDEMIHTENSYKFYEQDIASIGNYGDLEILNVFSDNKQWFSLVQFIKNS